MASQEPAPVDKDELEHLEQLWVNFGVWSKWGIIFIVIALIGLALLTL